jgi:hypothetical protein
VGAINVEAFIYWNNHNFRKSLGQVFSHLARVLAHRFLDGYGSKLGAFVLLSLSISSIQAAHAQLQLGSLLLVDPAGGTGLHGSLPVIDQTTGDRTVFSDFGVSAQGPLGAAPCSVAVLPGLLGLGDALFVLDSKAGTSNKGVLFTVEPGTGIRHNRRILSDFGASSQGPLGVQCSAVIAAPGLLGLGTTQILVVDEKGGTNQRGAIFLIDSLNGQGKLLSDFGSSSQDPLGAHPVSAAVSPDLLDLSNTVLILDSQAGTNGQGALFVLNSNGFRVLLSDFGDYTEGPYTQPSSGGGGAEPLAVVNVNISVLR